MKTTEFYFNEMYQRPKRPGHVWRIKTTIGDNYKVYNSNGRCIAKFINEYDAEEYLESKMSENDVIAYN